MQVASGRKPSLGRSHKFVQSHTRGSTEALVRSQVCLAAVPDHITIIYHSSHLRDEGRYLMDLTGVFHILRTHLRLLFFLFLS